MASLSSSPRTLSSASPQFTPSAAFQFCGSTLGLWGIWLLAWLLQVVYIGLWCLTAALLALSLGAGAVMGGSGQAALNRLSGNTSLAPQALGSVLLLLQLLATVLVLPVCVVLFLRWKRSRTMYAGIMLEFRGTATGLMGHVLLWVILIPCTLFLFLFFVRYFFLKWRITRTYWNGQPIVFKGNCFEEVLLHFLYLRLLPQVTIFLLYPFGVKLYQRWLASRTYLGGRPLEFEGSSLVLLGWLILKYLFFPLHILTLSLSLAWIITRVWKWEIGNLSAVGGFGPGYQTAPVTPAAPATAPGPAPKRGPQEAPEESEAPAQPAPTEAELRAKQGEQYHLEAREAAERKEWRRVERAVSAYLGLFPDDAKMREYRDRTAARVEALAQSSRRTIVAHLSARQAQKALEISGGLPAWLRGEPPVAEALRSAQDFHRAHVLLLRGRLGAAARHLKRWRATPEFAWVEEWMRIIHQRLQPMQRKVRKWCVIAAVALILAAPIFVASELLLDFYAGPSIAASLLIVAPFVLGTGWLPVCRLLPLRNNPSPRSFQEVEAGTVPETIEPEPVSRRVSPSAPPGAGKPLS